MFKNMRRPNDTLVRNASRFLYQFEAIFGGIILGIVSWYLSHWKDTEFYPGARLCFTVIFAGIAIIYGSIMIWTWNWFPRLFAVWNSLLCLAFFSAYGALQQWDCDKNWVGWETQIGHGYKACWKATEAFAFINGFCFLVSTIFALWTPSSAETHQMHMYHRKHSSEGSTSTPSQQV